MSPLTKLFVVLLVLVSVALSAGTITFVNKLDPLQKRLLATETQLTEQREIARRATESAEAKQAALEKAQTDTSTEVAQARKDVLAAQTALNDKDVQIAKLTNQVAVLTAANNSSSTALAASESSKSQLQDQVTGLRKDADDRLRQVADLGTRVNTLVAQLDQTEKARRAAVEQLTDANGRADRQSRLLKDLGATDAQLANAGTGAGAPAINGVIRGRRNIAGKEYATISIGSSDYVTKGMQFKILDANSGQFLGLLQVESVESNEAIGQISAEPQNLAQIRAGNVVRTQI